MDSESPLSGVDDDSLSSSNNASVEAPPNRKRPRSSENKNNKDYVIEWPSTSDANGNNGGDLKLDALVTFLKTPSSGATSSVSNNKLCLMGRAQIQCLEGSISIFGHQLEPNQEKLQVESPPWSSLLVLEPNRSNTTRTAESTNKSAVVRVESWWPQSAENHFEATFELVKSQAPGVRPTFIPPTWEHAIGQVLPDLKDNSNSESTINKPSAVAKNSNDDNKSSMKTDKGFRMAICGAKGVGKSTFLRYATNRILSSGTTSQVAILDADVGQPEMSPPGLVTLTVLSKPILTPPHYRSMAVSAPLHHQQYSYFFGSITSKPNPHRYLQLLQRLIGHYEEDVLLLNNLQSTTTPVVPLLINLDGWVKGLGFELLSTILTEILDPLSHVVQIVGTTKSKQFALREVLNPEATPARLHVIHSYDSSLNVTTTTTTADSGKDDNAIAYVNNQPKVPVSCVMPAQGLRALRLCTYFLNDVTIWYNLGFNHEGIKDDTCEIAHRLAGAMPYAVPFEAVEAQWEGSDHFQDLEGNFDLVLNAINAKIVGLCCRNNNNNSRDDNDSSEQGAEDLLSCVGLGLVRAIDRVQRMYYILTPVDPEKLQRVNVLMGGQIEVPIEFCFRGVHAEAFPYQTFAPPITTVGAEPMKSRNNIARRGLVNGANAK